jgi:hypothetical protein
LLCWIAADDDVLGDRTDGEKRFCGREEIDYPGVRASVREDQGGGESGVYVTFVDETKGNPR